MKIVGHLENDWEIFKKRMNYPVIKSIDKPQFSINNVLRWHRFTLKVSITLPINEIKPVKSHVETGIPGPESGYGYP